MRKNEGESAVGRDADSSGDSFHAPNTTCSGVIPAMTCRRHGSELQYINADVLPDAVQEAWVIVGLVHEELPRNT